MDVVGGIDPRYEGTNVHDLRGYFLRRHYEVVQKSIGEIYNAWMEIGCIIMAARCTDT